MFIHKGQLHIIPKPRSPAEVTVLPVSNPTIQEAVQIVLNKAIPTLASEPIQQCIQERLKRLAIFDVANFTKLKKFAFTNENLDCSLPAQA